MMYVCICIMDTCMYMYVIIHVSMHICEYVCAFFLLSPPFFWWGNKSQIFLKQNPKFRWGTRDLSDTQRKRNELRLSIPSSFLEKQAQGLHRSNTWSSRITLPRCVSSSASHHLLRPIDLGVVWQVLQSFNGPRNQFIALEQLTSGLHWPMTPLGNSHLSTPAPRSIRGRPGHLSTNQSSLSSLLFDNLILLESQRVAE